MESAQGQVAPRKSRRWGAHAVWGVLAVALFVGGVVLADQPTVLEANHVQSFETTVVHAGGHTRLRLSGLAFHSALAVERLERNQDGAVLNLRILLVPTRPGLSGSFDYTIDVPPSVSSVTFGVNGTVIWSDTATR